ncbi:VgrG-related protein [Actinokineospora sp. NBRC 105648]|uniref:VgrG-related protein n=1 Tax=Actinokineospora sp. NBRC 105648 TaxID=3032206 RepID=UPI0024A0BAAA|nr:VgrG-related protein [Actinokineospora sp. NBRC 105648]GLZ42716.1 type IV secretion protein Rhs [Actinokineospora sp. NBRC 105648]
MGSVSAHSERSFAAEPIVTTPGKLPDVWQELLVRTVVDENVGLPDAATLTFRDPHHRLLAETGIAIGGQLNVAVSIADGAAPEPLFAGEVTAVELDSDLTGTFTVVRALSKAHRLMRGRRVKAFRNMTATAIVRQVAQAAGLVPGRIEAAKIIYPQLTQANVSDWDFLSDLARGHGTLLRVDQRGRLDFVRPKPATGAPPPSTPASRSRFVLEFGDNLLTLRAVLTAADQSASVQARGWNVASKKVVVANEPTTTSKTVKPGLAGNKVSTAFGRAVGLVTDVPHGTQAEAGATARARADEVSAGVGEVEAVVEGDPKLRAGAPVTLSNVGPQFSGRYTATSVRHTIDSDQGYRTTVAVSSTPDRSLAALASGRAPVTGGPRIPGVVTGIVTDIKETGGKQRGWVKLKFPWLDDSYESDWARSVQWGGQGGGVFSPEVDDEVLVAFEQGSLDRPYVIGGLYNGRDVPSKHRLPLVDRAGKVNRRSLVSRKGHRVELIDGLTGPPGVRIASGDDRLEVRLDDTANSIALTVYGPGGRRSMTSILLDPRGITLDAGAGKLTLLGGEVSIAAQRAADIDGGLLASLSGRIVRLN